MQLRYLQTLTEIAGEKSSTIVFPVPLDVLNPLLEKAKIFAVETLQRALEPRSCRGRTACPSSRYRCWYETDECRIHRVA